MSSPPSVESRPMTDDQLNAAIARAVGWTTPFGSGRWRAPDDPQGHRETFSPPSSSADPVANAELISEMERRDFDFILCTGEAGFFNQQFKTFHRVRYVRGDTRSRLRAIAEAAWEALR